MKKLLLIAPLIICANTVFAVKNISQKKAQSRAEQVGELSYQLSLDLTNDIETFEGTNQLHFNLKNTYSNVDVDFDGKEVKSMTVNGSLVEDINFDSSDENIEIPKQYLKKGKNVVTINFVGNYSHNGAGLHKFVDPKDGKIYMYTDFEPADSHRLFPGFDQPDLKAIYKIDVTAPAEWEVISNAPPEKIVSKGDNKQVYFKPTKKLSSYIVNVTAGPFHKWEDNSYKIPLKIYARNSLAKYMDEERMFDTTKKGLEFFQDYYDFDYPFAKYDQLFVPEFNAGAMENAGAVTFRESMIFRNPPTESQLAGRDITILHEMAHMWFGDLVTMTWWNDLWLNESFADFMGYMGLAGIGNDDAWALSAGRKRWAYYEDQLMTTHPILAEIKDIEAAGQNFDGITYAKGLAAIRQLQYTIGDTKFRNGIRAYFKANAFKNTTLVDFISSLEKANGAKLDNWVDQWLATSDVNSMRLNIDSKDGKISKASVSQYSGQRNDVLRTHSNLIGLYYVENNKLVLKDKIKITFSGAETRLKDLEGKKTPAIIVTNIENYDYIKARFDSNSLNWLKKNMRMVTDDSIKTNIWDTLWDMVRDQEMKASDMFDMIYAQLPYEKDPRLFKRLRKLAIGIVNNYTNEKTIANKSRSQLFSLAKNGIKKVEVGTDLQRYWYGMITLTAEQDDELDYLIALFDGQTTIEGIKMNNSRKWTILDSLADNGRTEDVDKRKQNLLDEDPTAQAKNSLLGVNSAKPDAKTKQGIWDVFTKDSEYSLREKQHLGGGLYNRRYPELAEPYIDLYFEQALELAVTKADWTKARYFLAYGFPGLGLERTVKNAEQFIKNDAVPASYKKAVMKKLDELQRTIKVSNFNN